MFPCIVLPMIFPPHACSSKFPRASAKDRQGWLKAADEIVSSIEKPGDLRFSLA
jgi:hypothetical protein